MFGVGIGFITGGPLGPVTVTKKSFASLRTPSEACTVDVYLPASLGPGVRWMLPVAVPAPALVVVTCMIVRRGPASAENVSACPSGSVAVIAWSAMNPAWTVMFAIGASAGELPQPVQTVTLKLFWVPRVPAWTRTVTV